MLSGSRFQASSTGVHMAITQGTFGVLLRVLVTVLLFRTASGTAALEASVLQGCSLLRFPLSRIQGLHSFLLSGFNH